MNLLLLAFILLPVAAVSFKVNLPSNVLFKMGDRRELTCSVRSCPEEVKFSWTSLEDKPLFATVENKHTESLLIFANVMKNAENTVVCKATCGKQSKQATTKIKVYSFPRNPVISGNDHMILGKDNVLTCEVSQVHPSEFLEVELLYEDEALVSKIGEDGTDGLKISHTFQPSSEDDGKAITCRASLNVEGIPPDERTKETSGQLRVLSAPHNVRVSGLTAVSLGSSLTLTCEAEGSPKPEFTWTALKPGGQSVKMGEHREIFIRNVTLSDAGVYQCEVSNILGRQTDNVSVVVQAFPRNPVISGNDHMILGEESVLNCEVSQVHPAEFLKVELLYEDKVLVSEEGKAGNDSLKIFHTFQPSSEDDGKAITCRASLNVEGIPLDERTKETSGHLTVLSAPHNVRVSGLTAVSLGSSLTLTCEAEGSPEPEFTWTAPDDQSVKMGEHQEIFIRNVTLSDAGVYQCEVSNNLGRQTASVSVVVQAPPMNTIIEASQQTVLKEGESISIFCKSDGVPVDRVVLRRMVDGRTTEMKSSVGSETSFTFESVKLSDSGFYQCTAFNKFGSQSASLNLMVEAYLLEVELQPSDAIVAESGSNLTLSCQASGCPQPKFSWKSLGNLPNRGLSKTDGFLSQLFLAPVAIEDEGTYMCEVTCGSVVNSKQTKVNVFSFPTSPVVESPGSSLEGEMINLTCTVLDVFPANFFRIVWMDGERELRSESGLFSSHLQNLTSVLSYRVEAKDQDKLITCKVLLDMNGVPAAQTVKTASTALSIHYPPRGTRITVIPQGELKEGESVSISCLSDSLPVGRVVLIRVVDQDGIESELMASDGVETSVILTSLKLDDSGLYVCKASNRHGSDSDSVEIKVKAPPRNTTVEVFPSSEVQEGQNITICCNSVSFPPPAVVLRKLDSETVIYSPDGVFQLINLTANDTGLYQVNVTNDLGYETEIFTIHVMEKRFESPPSWTDFITPAICLAATAALLGIMVYLWRDRKKGSYDLTKCNPDTV